MKTPRPSHPATPTREEQVASAIANAVLEGLHPTPEMREDLDAYVQGKITLEEGIRRSEARYAVR